MFLHCDALYIYIIITTIIIEVRMRDYIYILRNNSHRSKNDINNGKNQMRSFLFLHLNNPSHGGLKTDLGLGAWEVSADRLGFRKLGI